jgi:hypothetical protein
MEIKQQSHKFNTVILGVNPWKNPEGKTSQNEIDLYYSVQQIHRK